MKNYKRIFTIFCLLNSLIAFGQSYIGPKFGLSMANLESEKNEVAIDTKSKLNLQIGLVIDLQISPLFSVQPELSYMGRSYDTQVSRQEIQHSFSYLDLGALAKIRFGKESAVGGYFGAGPFVNYAMDGLNTIGSDKTKVVFEDSSLTRTDLSLAGALGLTFERYGFLLFLETRYILGLTDFDKTTDRVAKNRTISISSGILIPL